MEDYVFSIKKILCPVDLTKHSVVVAEYALAMAKFTNASLYVITVAPSIVPLAGVDGQSTFSEVLDHDLEEGSAFQSFVKENFAGIEVVVDILAGVPADEILFFAKENEIDLIVMGTQGRKGLGLIVFGSVAEKIVKNFGGPVLTIPFQSKPLEVKDADYSEK